MNASEGGPAVEIPQYRCHKVVRAAKITAINFDPEEQGARLMLGDIGGMVDVDHLWLGMHGTTSMVGGYYVVYEDGYASFSPAKAFEEGYARIERSQPGQFRKKPVVIAAAVWFKNGDHPDDYAKDHEGLEGGNLRTFTGDERRANEWEGDVVRYYRHPEVPGHKPCEQCGKPHHVHGWIDTLEQGHRVCPGDWIITGVKGERYPCKPDIFAATYEPA